MAICLFGDEPITVYTYHAHFSPGDPQFFLSQWPVGSPNFVKTGNHTRDGDFLFV